MPAYTEPEVVYFIGSNDRKMVKIGTTIDLNRRFSEIQNSAPQKLHVLLVLNGNRDDEHKFHRRFSHLRDHGEWFRISGSLSFFLARKMGFIRWFQWKTLKLPR